jgi:predicted nucleic acid-binding protein
MSADLVAFVDSNVLVYAVSQDERGQSPMERA